MTADIRSVSGLKYGLKTLALTRVKDVFLESLWGLMRV